MGILSEFVHLLSKSNKAIIIVPALTIGATAIASKELCTIFPSKDMEVGDSLEINTNKQENKVRSKKEIEQNREQVMEKHDIGFFRRTLYEIKDFFYSQDIISRMQREYKLDKNADVETYKASARKYYRKELGIDKNISEKKLKQNYEKIARDFILEITNMPKENRAMLIEVYSAVIGELDAESRAELAKEFMSIAESDSEVQDIAKALFDNAEYNLTNQDATGASPSKDTAVEYNKAVFANMRPEDIKKALDKMELRAEEVIERLNYLRTKEVLSKDEIAELKTLEIVEENYIKCGYSGANIGISCNIFVDNDFAAQCLRDIYQATSNLDIEEDVFEITREYMEKHPEIAEKIYELRHKDFNSLMNEATDGKFTVMEGQRYANELKYGKKNSKNPSSEDLKTEKTYLNETINSPDIDETEERTKANEQNSTDNNKKEQAKTTSNPINVTKTRNYYSDTKDAKEEQIQNDPDKNTLNSENIRIKKAMQSGVTEYVEFKKDEHISNIESCISILNFSQASPSLKQYALVQFKSLDKSVKKVVFPRLNTDGQIEASKVMTASELADISTFKSIYAKEYIEKRYEEECEKNKLLDNTEQCSA